MPERFQQTYAGWKNVAFCNGKHLISHCQKTDNKCESQKIAEQFRKFQLFSLIVSRAVDIIGWFFSLKMMSKVLRRLIVLTFLQSDTYYFCSK